ARPRRRAAPPRHGGRRRGLRVVSQPAKERSLNPVHVVLLNAQLVMGLDLSQAYNTQVFSDDQDPADRELPGEGAFMSIVQPRAALRLIYPMSEYQLEYQAGYTFYDFDPGDSELFHQAELRGTWEVGESTNVEAVEQVQYGSGNTLRQLDTTTIGVTEFTAARTRYILNHGRLTYRTELGTVTQFDGTLSYLLRRSLDPESSDIPVFNYDTLAPEADLGLTRNIDEDNQIGLRTHYN